MKLLKDIMKVALSNIVHFGASFIIGFVLPLVLSVKGYGYYKQYSLYLSFAYLFSLGYNDGVYIKYGGKFKNELDKNVVNSEHNFILIFQSLMMLAMIIASLLLENNVYLLFSIASFFFLLGTYHQNFQQAIAEYGTYSAGKLFSSAVYTIVLLAAVFLVQTHNYVHYVLINIFSYFVLFAYYEYVFYKNFGYKATLDVGENIPLFKVGFFVLIANMSLTFVGNVGSWISNSFFSIEEFAYYSFQNSILNVALLIINAIGQVFYSVISRNKDEGNLNLIKKLSLILGIYGGLGFFIIKEIVFRYIPKYSPSIPILAYTFIVIPYLMVSKILIANLFKTRKSEKRYFFAAVLYALLSFILVGSMGYIFGTLESLAVGTTISYILWYIYSTEFEFPTLKNSKREIVVLISHLVVLYLTTHIVGNILISVALYIIYLVVISYVLKDDIINLYNYVAGK